MEQRIMLGGERQVGLINDIYPKPSLGQTFGASVEKPFLQVEQLGGYIFPGLSTEQSRRQTADRLSVIDETLSDPRQGYGQLASNAIGSLIGTTLPTLPLAVAGGAVGGLAAGAIGFGARTLAFEAGNEALLSGYISTQVPLSRL